MQAGDVSDRIATLWARAAGPGRVRVELDDGPHSRQGPLVRGPVVSETTDFAGQGFVGGLPVDERVRYRVWLERERGRSGSGVERQTR